MGLAASQARLLTITARLADNELRSQTINNAKMRLATQSSQASDDYISALNNAQLMFSNTDTNGLTRNQVLTYNNLTAYSQYNNQYGLVNSAGLLLVSERDAKIYEASNGDMNKFLEAYGLEWNTTYFNDTTGLQKSASTELSEKLTSFYRTDQDSRTGLWNLGVLFEGMTNEQLEKLYQDAQTNEASIERMNYDNFSKAYYNQIKDLADAVMPIVREAMFGDSNTTTEEDEARVVANIGFAGDRTASPPTGIIGYLLNGPCSATGEYDYSLNGLLAAGMITTNTYDTLSTWIKSLTDAVITPGGYDTGCMDVELPYGPSGNRNISKTVLDTTNYGPYNYGDTIPTKNVNKTYPTYTIAGIEIGFNVPQFKDQDVTQYESDGTTLKTTTYEVENGTKDIVASSSSDGANATYPDSVLTEVENYLRSQGITNPSGITTAHVQHITDNILHSKLDTGGIDPKLEDPTKENDCVYRFIDNKICRVPLAGYRTPTGGNESFYYDFALTYFQAVLEGAGSVAIMEFANNNLGNSALGAYKEAMDKFQLYDKQPVAGTRAGDGTLTTTVTTTPAYLLNFVEMLQKLGMSANSLLGGDFGSDAFKSVLKTYLSELMLQVLGEPKYTWIDTTDPSATQNADAKAQWYENLFNRMQRGYKVLENGLANSKEWIEYAFESGLVTMEQVDKSYNWLALDYKTCTNIYEDSDTSDLVAKAEAKYNRAMNDIKQKDNMYDLQLKNIDTEHQSLQTEYDSVKGVMSKNIERTMKFDQSA